MAAASEEGTGTEVPVPEEWGWPKEPYQPEALNAYVIKTSQQAEEERLLAMKGADIEGIDKPLMADSGVDPNAFKAGKWFSFMNHKGDCRLYVHNYTRNITALRPPNFYEMTEEEKRAIAQLGIFMMDLHGEVEKVYRNQKAIPFVLASEETCEALMTFARIDAKSRLLDTTTLRRIRPAALEDARQSIVYALKEGCTLWVWLGDNDMPNFEEKVCTSKNRDKFPMGLFTYGGLESKMVREKIYRDADLEEGECKMKPDFKVVFFAKYDNYMHVMSGVQRSALQDNIPYFEGMQMVKAYNEADKEALLTRMRNEERKMVESEGRA